ncbi:MAG: DUF2158 domain-containing protein [Novosphingobium sp.]|nr:DUF2158 domain-containing protein [Novosphingobium sp.]
MEIEIGSVVMLKSGGPAMTVKSTFGATVTCVWQDSDGKLNEAAFDQALLRDGSVKVLIG